MFSKLKSGLSIVAKILFFELENWNIGKLKEIERKFLVEKAVNEQIKLLKGDEIKQGYLSVDQNSTIRVRAFDKAGNQKIASYPTNEGGSINWIFVMFSFSHEIFFVILWRYTVNISIKNS